MARLSLLPEYFSTFESYITHFFILLAIITIGPWLALLLYDLLLYLVRSLTYEVPLVGGRARGWDRPRAPSLSDRPGIVLPRAGPDASRELDADAKAVDALVEGSEAEQEAELKT